MNGAICIRDALVLEGWDAQPRPATILIEEGHIAAVADGSAGDALAARAIDVMHAPDTVVMPGLINAHHHAYANVLRGTENSLPLELWAPFTTAYGRALDAEMLRLGILLGAAEMLRNGVTTVVDHSPQAHLHETAFAAHLESGMRVAYAPMFHDRHDHDLLGLDLPPALRAYLESGAFAPPAVTAAMFRSLAAAARTHDRITILLGPNAPQRCSDKLLGLWRTLRDELGLMSHTHLLETQAQAATTQGMWPGGLLRELDRRDLLSSGLSAAHGIWLEPAERELLARRGIVVVHNPASNLMLGSGRMPLEEYRQCGVTLALGSDSANTGGAANPFELMRLAMMLPRIAGSDWRQWPAARDALRMATEGGAAVLGLAGKAGRVAAGFVADLTLVACDGAGIVARAPRVETLVQHGGPQAVRATMVAGRWAYRDGKIAAFDEAAVIARFRERIDHVLTSARDGVAVARSGLQA